jgi:isoleucyl-tRNA synthetase
VTGALEIERAAKRIGSSLEAAPIVHIADPALREAVKGLDLAELCITSGLDLRDGEGPADAFRLDDVKGVAVVFSRAEGRKCARSWKISARGRAPTRTIPTSRPASRHGYCCRRGRPSV